MPNYNITTLIPRTEITFKRFIEYYNHIHFHKKFRLNYRNFMDKKNFNIPVRLQ